MAKSVGYIGALSRKMKYWRLSYLIQGTAVDFALLRLRAAVSWW